MENLQATRLNMKEWASITYSNYADQLATKTLTDYIKSQLRHCWEESGRIPELEEIVYGLLECDELFQAKFGTQLEELENTGVEVESELMEFVDNLMSKILQ